MPRISTGYPNIPDPVATDTVFLSNRQGNVPLAEAVAAGGALMLPDAGLLATQDSVLQIFSDVVTFPANVVQGDLSGAIRFDRAGTLLYLSVWCDFPPATQSLIVDGNKNGTTVYTTQANRPTIPVGQSYVRTVTPNVTALIQGDRIQFEIDQLNAGDVGDIGQVYCRATWVEPVA